ncbi:MAG: methyltransferase domain-containing protein [Actinomycetota bacterium]
MRDRFASRSQWFDEHYSTARGRVRLTLVLERIRRRLPSTSARILDAGGGTGAFAIPLAIDGHQVTILDGSPEWLDRARTNAETAGVDVEFVVGRVEDAASIVASGFDAALCHAVLMYTDDPCVGLAQLRSIVRPGGGLSLLDKNADAIALRPGLQGNYREAEQLLHHRVSTGRLGVENRAHTIPEWASMLRETGWGIVECAGVRLFSDVAPDDLPGDEFEALLSLEREAGGIESYRSVSRLVHIWAE